MAAEFCVALVSAAAVAAQPDIESSVGAIITYEIQLSNESGFCNVYRRSSKVLSGNRVFATIADALSGT